MAMGVGRNNSCQCLGEGLKCEKINILRCERTPVEPRRDRRLKRSQQCHRFFVSATPRVLVLWVLTNRESVKDAQAVFLETSLQE